MPRKGPADRRELTPDPVYRSTVVTQLVNKVLQRGKRSTAERIVYTALSTVEQKTGSEPVGTCLLYTSPSPRDRSLSRMPSSA